MAKPLYDIQGKPIKVGYLVAVPDSSGILHVGRVAEFELWHGLSFVVVHRDRRPSLSRTPNNCVVIEEPVWPNK